MAPTVATSSPVPGWGRLGWLTLLGAPAALAGCVYAATGRGVPCPVLLATGWLCPFCGGSRMAAALVAGDLGTAWRANPFALVLAGVLGAVWLWTAVCVASGRPARLPGILGRLDRLQPASLVALVGVPALIFALARNLG